MHNHDVTNVNVLSCHSFMGPLNEEESKQAHEITKYHLALRQILNLLQDQNKDNWTSMNQVYNIQSKY
jgi:hypothetical protein